MHFCYNIQYIFKHLYVINVYVFCFVNTTLFCRIIFIICISIIIFIIIIIIDIFIIIIIIIIIIRFYFSFPTLFKCFFLNLFI